jgi:hypothetical protein
MQRPEEEIVLVSHGYFLHFLTDDWIDSLNTHGMLLLGSNYIRVH